VKFQEYYQYYLTLHQNKWCRRLHVIGQVVTISFLSYVLYTGSWLLLPLVPLIVYPFAWTGHFAFEKNTPAAFSRPLWAKACDWLMLRDVLLGRIKW